MSDKPAFEEVSEEDAPGYIGERFPASSVFCLAVLVGGEPMVEIGVGTLGEFHCVAAMPPGEAAVFADRVAQCVERLKQ